MNIITMMSDTVRQWIDSVYHNRVILIAHGVRNEEPLKKILFFMASYNVNCKQCQTNVNYMHCNHSLTIR